MTIEEFKQKLTGLPKEEKVNIIKQELTNRAFANAPKPNEGKKEIIYFFPPDEELKVLQQEIENNVEAYESKTKRKELVPFMCDRDLNWYFNSKNIPHSKACNTYIRLL